jgi:hypothetical protein
MTTTTGRPRYLIALLVELDATWADVDEQEIVDTISIALEDRCELDVLDSDITHTPNTEVIGFTAGTVA